MSTRPERNLVDADASDEAVHDYLTAHPDFFERHTDLLRSLRLPHVTGGTVSLVERQVSELRERDLRLERRLNDLLAVARSNDALAERIHRLCLRLLAARTLAETIDASETALRTEFNADQAVLVLFRDDNDTGPFDAGRFLRLAARNDAGLKAFRSFLRRSAPRCGQIRDAQRSYLFGEDAIEVGSCALVPLGRECELGFLAIGSADVARFTPAMSMEFLTRVGELLSAALSRA